MQLRGDDLISAPAYARGGGTLTESLNGQLGARPDVRRALASAPYVVADDGTMLPGRHVCVDLFADLGPHARAVPNYLTPLVPFLVEVGGALTSSALAAPEVVVSAPNPFESLLPKLMLQWDEPAFADVIFEFDGGIEAGGTAVYAHKLVLALTSPHFATMFTSGLVEGQGGKQRLPMDSSVFGPDALRLTLCYAYQGELPLTLSTDASHHHRTHTGGGGGAGGVGGGRVAPLAPTSEGVSRLLELLLVSDYFELSHLKQTVERLIVEWDVLQVENVVWTCRPAGVRRKMHRSRRVAARCTVRWASGRSRRSSRSQASTPAPRTRTRSGASQRSGSCRQWHNQPSGRPRWTSCLQGSR